MRKNIIKICITLTLLLFLLSNVIIYNHAYHFTHFTDKESDKTKRPEKLSFFEKINTILWGVSLPKADNKFFPTSPYETIYLESQETLEAWKIPVKQAKGIVLLFHGYNSCKSDLLRYATAFQNKGYTTFLVDFMGSGGSTGFETTIGFKEGKDVKVALDYIKKENPKQEIVVFGASMGASAVLQAIANHDIQANKVILECPFGSLLTTTRKRFEAMNLPSFPFAESLLFYGGLQTGFNAFQHKPIEYAKKNTFPTLLLYGAKDARVTLAEVSAIYENLAGQKELVILNNSAHEVYLNDDATAWHKAIDNFLQKK